MFAIAAVSWILAAELGSFAVSSLDGHTVEISTVSLTGDARRLYSFELPHGNSTTVEDFAKNAQLADCLPLTISHRRKHLLILQIDSMASAEGDVEVVGRLVTIPLSGGSARYRPYRASASTKTFVGWDDTDTPTVIRQTDSGQFLVNDSTKAVSGESLLLPRSFRELLVGERWRRFLVPWMEAYQSPNWAELDDPDIARDGLNPRYVSVSVSPGLKGWTMYNGAHISANWNGRIAERDFAGLRHVQLAAFPFVAHSKSSVLTENPLDRAAASEIFLLNVESGESRRLCRGAFAIWTGG